MILNQAEENKEWKVEYMTLLMRGREKYKEGKAEGIIKVLLKRRCSADEIADELQNELEIDAKQAEDYLKRFSEGTL